ncbi:hypothetical protein L9F63_004095 [Diploptera punctata]|uniref:Transmembrane protein 87A n=1 Tax=Diploptera punctata TaxID=6984 RepID=A0AAD7ZHM7_DIPPU|nr:hypothetical protein L9F63_004095 [Diploptera punctata]
MSFVYVFKILYLLGAAVIVAAGFPDQGKWEFLLTGKNKMVNVPKSLFKGSQIFIKISCEPDNREREINITWILSQTPCWQDVLHIEASELNLQMSNQTHSIRSCQNATCTSNIIMEEYNREEIKSATTATEVKREDKKETNAETNVKYESNKSKHVVSHPVYTIEADGIYLLKVIITSPDPTDFNTSVTIEMQGRYGYLSAADWPLLPFYGAMCLVYVIFGLAWLIVSFCQWRDLLRIQFWIGGVILLGMLEKATFYAEYQSINSTGVSVKGAMLLAELVSCGKRTLARMLVIIVSLGFGIVKPRLGPMLHRVVGTGLLYFTLAAIESYLRIMHPKNDPSNQILVASIPLAVLDSAICWWIFTSLVQTTRTLRLRRNLVKLSLYRHFTNTLIFAVISSVVFMLYSIKYHHLTQCLTDWMELWVDDAYWHLLFSVLLLVIMILWRPTNNNQRYAFTPLLDAPEDDEEEDEQFVNDAFGVKMRGYRSNSPKPKSSNSVEDDLKWVEENIPASLADTALTTMDSDEEIMTTKFEVSKMQ